MSLDNIIKLMKSSEDSPSLLPKIEQYYLNTSFDRDFEKIMDKQSRFHPSSICYNKVCPRSYSIVMNRKEFGAELRLPDAHATSLLRVFDHGHSIHEMYQNKILRNELYGFWEKDGDSIEGFCPGDDWSYVEPRVWWEKYRMSGYIDGVVLVNGKWCVLEIKSCNSNSFKYIKMVSQEPREYHRKQALLYCYAPNNLSELDEEFDGAIILYVNKDTGEEIDFFVPKSDEDLEDIFSAIEEAIDCADSSLITPRLEECKSIKSKRAKECISASFCFSKNANRFES